MDFGDILSQWEKQGKGQKIFDKDTSEQGAAASAGRNPVAERRSRLLRKKPDAFIDLHGLNRDEAWAALETFFESSRRRGFEKLQIIHGKGNHRSEVSRNSAPASAAASAAAYPGFFEYKGDEGVLRDLSRRFIETCPFAGESGYSSARDGGSGATWVILKERG